MVTLADLGPARLSVLAFPEVRAVRTSALIRQSDPERYGLNLITGATPSGSPSETATPG